MYQHFVLITLTHSNKKICYHHVSKNRLDDHTITSYIETLHKIHKEGVGIHSFSLSSPQWESVIKNNSHFEDALVYNDFNEFITLLV